MFIIPTANIFYEPYPNYEPFIPFHGNYNNLIIIISMNRILTIKPFIQFHGNYNNFIIIISINRILTMNYL